MASAREARAALALHPAAGHDAAWIRTFLERYTRLAPRSPGGSPALVAPGGSNSIGMRFVAIPGGTYSRGALRGEADERPVRAITLSPFFIASFEVTVGQFRRFVDEAQYSTPAPLDRLLGVNQPDLPAFAVSWSDAESFAIWLSQRERAVYRLPTEAEWELAARGFSGFLQPWGNEPGQSQTDGNWRRPRSEDVRATIPPVRAVGSFPRDRSPFGVWDMAGNVQEWCLDSYDASYYGWSPTQDPYGPTDGSGLKVLRGGAWNHPGSSRFGVARSRAAHDLRYTGFGFRLVREGDSNSSSLADR